MAVVNSEVARCVAHVAEQASQLEGIGLRAIEQTAELNTRADYRRLLDGAHRIRSLVLHGFSVLVDLQYEAGRLDALSAVRRSTEGGRVDDANDAE